MFSSEPRSPIVFPESQLNPMPCSYSWHCSLCVCVPSGCLDASGTDGQTSRLPTEVWTARRHCLSVSVFLRSAWLQLC